MAQTPVILKSLKSRLLERDIRLNPPVSEDMLAEFFEKTGLKISPSILCVFRQFDGFSDDFDAATFTGVWPLREVLDRMSADKLPYLAFADLAFNAILFEASFADENAPVLAEGTEQFPNYISFWEGMLSKAPIL